MYVMVPAAKRLLPPLPPAALSHALRQDEVEELVTPHERVAQLLPCTRFCSHCDALEVALADEAALQQPRQGDEQTQEKALCTGRLLPSQDEPLGIHEIAEAVASAW